MDADTDIYSYWANINVNKSINEGVSNMKYIIIILALSQSAYAGLAEDQFNLINDINQETRQRLDNDGYGMKTPDYQKQEVIIWDSENNRNCYYSGDIKFCD